MGPYQTFLRFYFCVTTMITSHPKAASTEAPKIEFPCTDYPVKVLGVCADDYVETIFNIVRKHSPECQAETIQVRESSKGTFQSCTLYITATSIEQLHQLHTELMAHEYVRMVI